MDGWQFAASVIGSLAWPAAVIGLAIVFRLPLRRLLSGDVRRWKAGPSGVEVEFREPLQERVAETRQLLDDTQSVATAELKRRIAEVEGKIAKVAIEKTGELLKERKALQHQIEELSSRAAESDRALASWEETLDHLAHLAPGVRGTVTFAAVAGRRPTVTVEVVRPNPPNG